MYRYILSSDSVIGRMESDWYRNLEKNNRIYDEYSKLVNMYEGYEDPYWYYLNKFEASIEQALLSVKDIKVLDIKYRAHTDDRVQVKIDTPDRGVMIYVFGVVFESGYVYVRFYATEDMQQLAYAKDYKDKYTDAVLTSPYVLGFAENIKNFTNKYTAISKGRYSHIAFYNPLKATYFYLFKSLIAQRGKYLIQDMENDEVFYQISGVTRAKDGDELYYRVNVLVPSDDSSNSLSVLKKLKIIVTRTGYVLPDGMNIPTDGTCPTIVSRDEAIPQKTLF